MYSVSEWGARSVFAALVFLVLPACAQENIRAVGAVIAPAELVAAYSCTTYAEAKLMPDVVSRGKVLVSEAKDKESALRRVLTQYDSVVEKMCREASVIFRSHRDDVLQNYASHLPGSRSDISTFLAKPNARRWAEETVDFLKNSAPLIQYYGIVKSVAPEILTGSRIDHVAKDEAWQTSVGMSAKFERQILIVLLADEGFARVAPARFDLASLKLTEMRLRKEAASLKYATEFYWFNDNASDLVRFHFCGFDDMIKMGLADVYIKNHQHLKELLK